jgi:hypothetical protein
MRENLNILGLRALSFPLIAACLLSIVVPGCSDSQGPESAAILEIKSGNNQYSFHGTALPEPFVVIARTINGTPAEDAGIKFSIQQGNGALSSSLVRTNADGLAGVTLTLSPENGTNVVRATLSVNDAEYVLFTATAADFYCREAELTPSITYGTSGNIFLATFKSAIYTPEESVCGIVLINPLLHSVAGFREFPTNGIITIPWDISFSPRGDLFFSMSPELDKIVKVATNGEVFEFGIMDDPDGAELATNPTGMVAGCDRLGPFIIQCDHSILRFDEAYYPARTINNDAMAVDQTTEDIYFIDTADSTVYRLPVDSLAAEGPPEEVAYLTTDEAAGANGMVCDLDGTIYILVDTDQTKELLKVNPAGGPASAKTVLYDFFSRGAGSLAGKQRDLAIDTRLHFLYTIDTLNDELLGYNLTAPTVFGTVFSSEDLSLANYSGERVGLVVLP